MAGAFPLIQESSSMEYTTNEDKIFYWPGPPILGEMVADDLVVVRPGRALPRRTRKMAAGTGKEVHHPRRSAPSEQALGMEPSRSGGGVVSPTYRM
ncbi:hypothetical protein E4U57_005453 [Claviceps arundinis]|uniref:Uncharacterized protein n=1 Tax=Claviceps arundinis TaxID=1623583 RepID=A0ABQ7P700_9HYPO|nr:hypothetical protein E4U57_005453 [Claviceps arundinis]